MSQNRFFGSPPSRDALVIFGLAVALLTFFISTEAFEYVVEFSDAHERWEIDEMLVTLMVLPFAFGIYAYRRLKEARSELHKRVAAERKAESMALHDPLTGLPNRRKANMEIASAMSRAAETQVTLWMIDLNRFKAANDLYGHSTGDKLLLESGERLKRAAGPDALVSRLGGDEFLVLLPDVASDELLLHLLAAAVQAFNEPFLIDGQSIMIGASIGVSRTSDPAMKPGKLMSQADAAMYRAKSQGRSAYRFFEEGMEMAAVRRAKIENDLRLAIAAGRIEPYFQPLVRISDGTIIGFEALARWQVDDESCLLPEEFVPIAEETSLINDLYFVILEKTVQAMRGWSPEWRASINVSPAQFKEEWLVERTLQTVAHAGIAPGRIEIEITETALMGDLEQAREVIRAFKTLGFHVALDDFGTGYSSLRHLSELQFDQLKIDRSFISDINSNDSSQTIVRTITSMAHNLGVKVTVEGVETPEEASKVASFGCDLAQGFFYGMPEPHLVYGPLLPSNERPRKKSGGQAG